MNNNQKDIVTSTINSPSIKNVKNLFILSLILVAVFGNILQKINFWLGLSLTETLLILLPTVIFIYKGKFSPRLVLRLNYPGIIPLLIGIIIGICVWPLGFIIQINLLNLFSSASYDIMNMISEISHSNMIYRLIILGFLAGICEEILFRGYIQTAIENKFGIKKGIIWTTILFSVFHLEPVRIIAVLPIALLMSWTCWKFNSIFPAILIHFSNNFLAPYIFSNYEPSTLRLFYLVTIICGLFIFIIFLFANNLVLKNYNNSLKI